MKLIWTNDEAEFHGNHVDFDPIWSWPKPVQKPPPPILIGGETIHTLKRVVDHADGWLPRAREIDKVFDGMSKLKEIAEQADRDPATIGVSAFAPAPNPENMDRLRAANVDRIILWLPPEDNETTLSRLEKYANYLN